MCNARRNIIFKIMNYACYGGRYIAKIWNILKIRRKGVKVLWWTMSLTWYTKSVKCIENREKKKVCYGGHYIIPQSQFWHLATQLSTTNEHFISDLDFPNSHYIFIHFEKPFRLHFPIQRMNENYVYLNSQRGSPLYKLFGAGWGQKGVGGIFLKIRPHSCM